MFKKIILFSGLFFISVITSINVNIAFDDDSRLSITMSEVEALANIECSASNPYGGQCYAAYSESGCSWCGCEFTGYSSDFCYYG